MKYIEIKKFIEIKSQNNKFQQISINFNKFLFIFFLLPTSYFLLPIYATEPATITGDKMKILQKGDILEFIGNVKFVQRKQNLTITADEMKSNEKTGVVLGKGNICIYYSSGTDTMYGWGDNAEYNKNSGKGVFTGNIKLRRVITQNTTGEINLTCEELEVFEFGDSLHAKKNVKIFQPQIVSYSDEAFYDHKINEILLLGGPPKIIKTEENSTLEYSGDKITIAIDKEIVSIAGNVKTKMVFK